MNDKSVNKGRGGNPRTGESRKLLPRGLGHKEKTWVSLLRNESHLLVSVNTEEQVSQTGVRNTEKTNSLPRVSITGDKEQKCNRALTPSTRICRDLS